MDYIPTTEIDRKNMLKKIGIDSINEITKGFVPVISNGISFPKPMSEQELIGHLTDISKMNRVKKYFIGAGSYYHYIPSAVSHLVERGEFLTGYTPYQAEMSQGVLQAIYEYQSYICILTGMDIANASLYDGPSALAEAVILSSSYTGRRYVVVESGLHPSYLDVMELEIITAVTRSPSVVTDTTQSADRNEMEVRHFITNETACVVVQNPDFYGNIRDLSEIAKAAQESGALFVVCVVEPTSLAIIRPPGDYGADIVVGEGQSFGIPMSFGGPSLGFMAVKSFLLKKMPGRICGMTNDTQGNRGFVLTLQAREQHIRRERATSNITTNVALMALSSTIYLALMGKSGLKNVAKISMNRAHLLQKKLQALGFVSLNSNNFYNEFILKAPSLQYSLSASSPTSYKSTRSTRVIHTSTTEQKLVKSILLKLARKGIAGGLELGHGRILICCTEMNTIDDIETYESIVKEEVNALS
jgi:glycine dehydrogenase subunit 1